MLAITLGFLGSIGLFAVFVAQLVRHEDGR